MDWKKAASSVTPVARAHVSSFVDGQGASLNHFRSVGRSAVWGVRDAWSTLDAPELQTTKAPRLRGGSFVALDR